MAEPNTPATSDSQSASTTTAQSSVHLPRIAIKFCTQCKWNLRAAYFAQELLQTFSSSLGEVALIPTSGGIFTITLFHTSTPPSSHTTAIDTKSNVDNKGVDDIDPSSISVATRTEEVVVVQETLLWDRKTEGGFPETKELKSRVRNIIQPNRDLGHVDRSLKKSKRGAEVDETKSREEVVAEESAKEVMAEEKLEGEGSWLADVPQDSSAKDVRVFRQSVTSTIPDTYNTTAHAESDAPTGGQGRAESSNEEGSHSANVPKARKKGRGLDREPTTALDEEWVMVLGSRGETGDEWKQREACKENISETLEMCSAEGMWVWQWPKYIGPDIT